MRVIVVKSYFFIQVLYSYDTEKAFTPTHMGDYFSMKAYFPRSSNAENKIEEILCLAAKKS